MLTREESRDWLEDRQRENGNYVCKCAECGCDFVGHKRRVLCKKCATSRVMTIPPDFEKLAREIVFEWLGGEESIVDFPVAEELVSTVAQALKSQREAGRVDGLNEAAGLLNDCVLCIETAQVAITETTGRPWQGNGPIDDLLSRCRMTLSRVRQEASK